MQIRQSGDIYPKERMNAAAGPVEDAALSLPRDEALISMKGKGSPEHSGTSKQLKQAMSAACATRHAAADPGAVSTGAVADTLLAKDALSDVELWRVKIPEGAKAPPAFGADGTLYITHDKGISVISPQGKVVREIAKPDLETEASPLAGSDGTLYVSGTYKTKGLTAYSPAGEILWEKDCGSSSIPPVEGPDGSILLGTNRGWVHKLGPDGSDRMWCPVDEAVGAKIVSMAVGPDGTIYASSSERGGLSVIDGKALLQYRQGSITFNAPRSDPQAMPRYETAVCPVSSPEPGFIYPNNFGDLSYRKPDGTEIWRVSSHFMKKYEGLSPDEKKEASKGWIDSAFGTTPVLSKDGGTMYAGTVPLHKFAANNPPSLVALGLDGTVRWKTELPLPIRDYIGPRNVQVGDDGTIYVAGEHGGLVVAVSPEGKPLWGFREGSYNKDFRIATRGDITYLTTKDGSVHALKSDALRERLKSAGDGADNAIPVIVVEDDMISIDGLKLPIQKHEGTDSRSNNS
jgi:outer membrane protein assembly factor BamB